MSSSTETSDLLSLKNPLYRFLAAESNAPVFAYQDFVTLLYAMGGIHREIIERGEKDRTPEDCRALRALEEPMKFLEKHREQIDKYWAAKVCFSGVIMRGMFFFEYNLAKLLEKYADDDKRKNKTKKEVKKDLECDAEDSE